MSKIKHKEVQDNRVDELDANVTADSFLYDAHDEAYDDIGYYAHDDYNATDNVGRKSTSNDTGKQRNSSARKSSEKIVKRKAQQGGKRGQKKKSSAIKNADITEVAKSNVVVKELAITDISKSTSKSEKFIEDEIEVEQVDIERVEVEKNQVEKAHVEKIHVEKVQVKKLKDVRKDAKRTTKKDTKRNIEWEADVEAKAEAKAEAEAEAEAEAKTEAVKAEAISNVEIEEKARIKGKPRRAFKEIEEIEQDSKYRHARKRTGSEKRGTRRKPKEKPRVDVVRKGGRYRDSIEYEEDREQIGKTALMQLFLGISIIVIVTGYIGVAMFFADVFFDNTFINGHDFSRRPPTDMFYYIDRDAREYILAVVDNSGMREEITGPEIGFALRDDGQIAQLFSRQNPFTWPTMFFGERNHEVEMRIGYCETRLFDRVADLVFTDSEAMAEPEDAKIAFDGERFYVQQEVMGVVVDGYKFTRYVEDAIARGAEYINIDDFDVRVMPNITSDMQEIVDAVNQLNHYLGASITYNLNPKQVVVDARMIIDWISYDEDFNVTFHEDRAREFISDFVETYSTYGTVRTFINPLGMEAQVSSVGFGWSLDEDTEVEEFLSNIKNGEVVYREPVHFQRGTFFESGEWGDTFIQINLTAQHMWYFEDGELALETPIVSGMIELSPTPTGVFDIQVMMSPTVLLGPFDPETDDYEWREGVSYWMQITRAGIGIHDAPWQPYFGSYRWTYGGSHGSINMPLDMAGQLYGMVTTGTIVIIHY